MDLTKVPVVAGALVIRRVYYFRTKSEQSISPRDGFVAVDPAFRPLLAWKECAAP
jgi:hypothetical protein